MSKFIALLLLLPFTLLAQVDHPEKLGLDLNNESDLAVYMMLYQIGLKERGQKLLGNHACVSLSRDAQGNTTLSFGINTDAFETGTVDFNNDNNSKFQHVKNTLSQLFGFFDEAKYNPQIGVRSYADPQQNIMSKYASGGAVSNRYSGQLFGPNASSDPRFNTDSKRRNYLLAYDRGQAFIDNYFPQNLKNKVTTTPYHSPDLEVGNNQSNSDQFACPNRRSIVVDMKFNPNFKVASTPGTFVPAFKVARGAENHENILAAAFDAENKKVSDLPLYCRNGSTAAFLERSKKEIQKVRRTFSSTKNLESLKKIISKNLSPEKIESFCRGGTREVCLNAKNEVVRAFSSYESSPSDENLYALVASLTITNDRRKGLYVRNICRASSGDKDCAEYQAIVDSVVPISDRMYDGSARRNSSHFMDCFSNKLFYQKEMQANPDRYLTPVVDLRDPQTGEMKIGLTPEHIPNTTKGKGFVCVQCGNGLKFANNQMRYSHRANGSDHTREQKNDSVLSYNGISDNASTQSMFMMGQQKGLNVYIVKDCNVANMDSLQQNSQMVSLQDLQEKRVAVSPNDCIFKPNVINSCVHAPAGEGEGDDNAMTYESTVPSFLTGKNIDLTFDSNANILNDVLTGLREDYIKTCQFNGDVAEDIRDTPESVIDNILCENRGIHIPKPSFNSRADCPDVAASISR